MAIPSRQGPAPANETAGSQVIRVPFLEESHFRSTDATKDNRFVNGFFEPITNQIKRKLDYFFIKRPGLSQNVRPSGTTGTGRGTFVWNGNIYSCIGTQLYKGSTNLSVTLSTSTGLVKWASSRPGAATPYLVLNDGQALYAIQSNNTVTQVVTNVPVNTRDIVFLDGYVLVLDTSANLWNSTFDNPTSWDGVSYITAQMLPGKGVGLARQGQYVVLFTEQHMQFFFDNASASGSPLANHDSLMQRVGCANNDTIGQIEDRLLWVGNGSQEGGLTVWMMQGTAAAKPVGNPTIDRIISLEGSSLSSARAIVLRTAGHAFYILTLSSANRTFVYDPDIDIWMEWTDTTGSNSWPILSVAQLNNKAIGMHTTNGWIYNIDPATYQDDSSNFTVTARTPRLDLDTMKRKFVDRMEIVCDAQASTENVTVSYSDDDYQTFSTTRTFDISKVRNFGRAAGNFRRRSWQLQYAGSQAFRALGFEFNLTIE